MNASPEPPRPRLEQWRETLREALTGDPLARRLTRYAVGFSAVLAVLVTLLQMYTYYDREQSRIDYNLALLQGAQLVTLEESLWRLDEQQLQLQLAALNELPFLERLVIHGHDNRSWQSGTLTSARVETYLVPLHHELDGKQLDIGLLELSIGLDPLWHALGGYALLTLGANLTKTLLVSLFILISFRQMVTRHLRQIASHASDISTLDDAAKPLQLQRRGGHGDALSELSFAINQLSHRLTAEQRSLRRSEERFRLALGSDVDAIWDLDVRSDRCWFAPNWQRIIGFSDAQMARYQWAEQIHPQDYPGTRMAMDAHFEGRSDHFHTSYRHRRGDGSWMWIEARGQCQRDALGKPTRFTGHLRDIDREHRAELALRDSETRLAEAHRLARLGSWEWDLQRGEIHLPADTCALLGMDRQPSIEPDELMALVHEADRAKLRALNKQVMAGDADYEIEYRIHRPDTGEECWLRSIAHAFRTPDTRLLRLVGAVQDISAQKRNEATVHRLAYYDELTGLPNRAQFRSHLESACQLAQHGHQQMALMFVDLDRFKNVNDTLGHAVGDGLLRRVARRLRSALRDSDVVARLGGDEFTVLLQNLRRPQDATHVAEQLLAELARPCEIHGHRVHTAGSIGITLCPQDGSDPDTLLRQADMAMYAAKRAGRNTMTYFTPALTERAQRYLQLEGLLRRRLAENTLEVYYQPVVNLASGAITGCECLLRCRDYRDELLNTEELVKVADEAGLSEQLFEHILRKVTAAARHWHDSDGNPLPINVNVASSQLRGALEQSTLLTQLETTQFDLSRLVLELTESAFIGPSPELPEWLRTLRQRGVRVALDDFGTGYSALGYLRRFPVDILKIDRSFVVDMIEDPTHEALVSAILAMANSLSLKVVAEGVETFSQAQRLQELGCHFGQGYLWSPGLPAKAFSELLATSTAVRHSYQN